MDLEWALSLKISFLIRERRVRFGTEIQQRRPRVGGVGKGEMPP